MSILESIQKFLSFADRDLLAYDIILGALIGGIGVGVSQASFIDDFPNIIELIIGSMMLLNEGFTPLSRSLGFVLTADGFSSLVKKVFFAEDCIPFNCLQIPFYELGKDPSVPIEDVLFINTKSPECKKYFDRFKEYAKQHHLVRGGLAKETYYYSHPSFHSNNQANYNEKQKSPSPQVSEQKQNESSPNSGPLGPYIIPAIPNLEERHKINEQEKQSNEKKDSDTQSSE